MNRYYAADGDRKQATFSELSKLLKAGSISNATLVWNATMDNWKLLADLPDVYALLVEAAKDGPAVEWYYVDKRTSSQSGPIAKSAFESLLSSGAIDAKSLVWKPSLSQWSPFSSVPELAQLARSADIDDAPAEWFYVDKTKPNQKAGPLPFRNVRAAFEKGDINLTTLVWKVGLPEWVKLSACEELEVRQLLQEQGEDEDGPGEGGPQTSDSKKRKNQSKKKKNWAVLTNHSNVYCQNLPRDVTVAELMSFFQDCGVFKLDFAGKPKVKVYTDDSGAPKGDGLVCFANEASVNLAITLKDDAEFRPGHKIKVQKADFQMKGEEYVKKVLSTEEKALLQKSKLEMKKKLAWSEGMSLDRRRIVIMKNMFLPEEAKAYEDPFTFYDGIRCEVGAEVERACGLIEKLTVFEGSPEGVIAIKFADPLSAETCITQFNGRWFAFRQLEAAYFDGTDYRVKETDAESQKRVEEFGAWLTHGGDGEDSGEPTPEGSQIKRARTDE